MNILSNMSSIFLMVFVIHGICCSSVVYCPASNYIDDDVMILFDCPAHPSICTQRIILTRRF